MALHGNLEGEIVMQTDYLRYLLKIIECGSMNKAANALYVTQVALTKAMQKLEGELNCELLVRTKSGVVLTDKGKRVYKDAQKILEIESGWRELSQDKKQLSGRVRVAIINSVCSSTMNRFIFSCREKYPGINLLLKEYRTYEFLKQFENRKVDIGISTYFENEKEALYYFADDLGLEIENLFQDRFYIFMSKNNVLSDKPYLESDDLNQLKFALYSDENDSISAPYIAECFKPENTYLMNSMQSMVRAVIEDDVTIFNTHLFANQNEYVSKGEIVYKEIIDRPLPTIYYMLRPKDDRITEEEQVIANLLRESLEEIRPDY